VKKLLGLGVPEKTSDYMGWLPYSYFRGYAPVFRDV
jgi:hypothetical protein